MIFDWDVQKAELNQKKHGVGFDEATTIFNDIFALEDYDINNSSLNERRYNRIGESVKKRILHVTYTVIEENTPNESYRIISAREAEIDETEAYLEEKFGSGFYE